MKEMNPVLEPIMREIILASGNTGKIRELSALLVPISCISQNDLGISSAEETGLSFVENAIIKARHVSSLAGKPALADDSGLVVPALDGDPGIYSARYAGPQANDRSNIELLLERMSHLQGEQRKAYFFCAIALVHHAKDPTPIITTGVFHGHITKQPSGNNGFGYDPVFYADEFQCTVAELPANIKNTITHRAKALNQLRDLIPDLYEQ